MHTLTKVPGLMDRCQQPSRLERLARAPEWPWDQGVGTKIVPRHGSLTPGWGFYRILVGTQELEPRAKTNAQFRHSSQSQQKIRRSVESNLQYRALDKAAQPLAPQGMYDYLWNSRMENTHHQRPGYHSLLDLDTRHCVI